MGLPAAGGLKIVPSVGRSGEKGIVCGAVENVVRGGATVGGVGATGVVGGKTCGVGTGGA